MTTLASAVVALENLIEAGAFASKATAEHQRSTNFASCLKPIACGVVALAKAKKGSLIDITECRVDLYNSISPLHGPHAKFIAFNAEAPGGKCVGSDTFGLYRELGLQAVILEVGYAHEGPKTEISLVLPAWGVAQGVIGAVRGVSTWGSGKHSVKGGDFAIVKFDTTGHGKGERYSPNVYTDEGTSDFTDTDAFLDHLLGIKLIEGHEIGFRRVDGTVNFALGFPGAEKYLAERLPGLGDYFISLAEKLATPSQGH